MAFCIFPSNPEPELKLRELFTSAFCTLIWYQMRVSICGLILGYFSHQVIWIFERKGTITDRSLDTLDRICILRMAAGKRRKLESFLRFAKWIDRKCWLTGEWTKCRSKPRIRSKRSSTVSQEIVNLTSWSPRTERFLRSLFDW
jgi:hypothetical protein